MDREFRLTAVAGTMMHTDDQLSLAAIRRIDEVCDEFERSCRAEQGIEISSLLQGWEGPQRSALVGELVLIDRHYAGLQGVRRERDDYLTFLPDDGPAIDEAFRQAINAGSVSTLDAKDDQANGTAARNEAASTAVEQMPGRIGRYQIVGRLGAGAFGVVYLAHDPELNRQVAIKCPKAEVWRADSRWEMFRREAERAAKLRHPGVVAIHDIGRDESGHPFFVMDYIRGESLKDRLSKGRIDWQNAAHIAIQLTDALGYVHDAGLVHRDLKPGNVILDESGKPHIADLGLALDAGETITDELAGTFAYMSPEQLRSAADHRQRQSIDHRCDVWAVGVMLYEMLVGRRPFEGTDSSELFRQIHLKTPRRPSSTDLHVPSSLTQICMKCLAKDPSSRYENARALADALRQVSNSQWSRLPRVIVAACALFALAALPVIGHIRSAGDSATDPTRLAAADESIAATPVPALLPFVVKSTGERFGDLAAAVTAASDGGIIEIDADGPLAIDQVDIGERRLTICAAARRRPVIKLADETERCLLRTTGALVLEGLDLRRGTPGRRSHSEPPALVLVEGPGSLRVKSCRLIIVSRTKGRTHCIDAAGDCGVEDSELIHQNGGGVMWSSSNGGRLLIDNCVVGVMNLAIVHPGQRPATSVEIRRSTVIAEQTFIVRGALPSRPEGKLLLRADSSYFDVDAVLVHVVPMDGSVPQMLAALTSALTWEGKQNVFAVRDTFVRSSTRDRQRVSLNVDSLAAWNELWGTTSEAVKIHADENRIPTEIFDYTVPISKRLDWMARVDVQQVDFDAGADLDSVGPKGSYSLIDNP
jgi:hypothetical protein